MFNRILPLACIMVVMATTDALSAPASAPTFDKGSLSGSYLSGRSATSDRDSDLAITYLDKTLDFDPNNLVVLEMLLQLEVASGDITAADESATKLLGFNSQQRLARTLLGLRDFRNKHFADARKNFNEAAYTPVGELTSFMLNAWSYAGENKFNEAIKELDKLDSSEAYDSFKIFHQALIADLVHSDVRAEGYYKKIYGLSPGSLRVNQAYGNFLERHKRHAEAIKIYEQFLKDGSKNVLIEAALKNAKQGIVPAPFVATADAGASEALFSLASALSADQTQDTALLYTQMALSLSGGDRPVLNTLLGDIYVDTKQYQNAIKAYEKVPVSSPLYDSAQIEIAVNYQRLTKTKEAQAKLEEVIARDVTDSDALVTLGNIYRNNEDYHKAADIYSRALALYPNPGKDQWQIFYNRGVAYERLKQWDKAEPDLRKALSFAPDEAQVLNYLGYSMVDQRINLDEALEMIKKAISIKPNDGYIVDSLGWAYYQLGNYDEATRYMERAVDLSPGDPTIAQHLGDVYWKTGRQLEAKFQWQHAKDNKPTPEELKPIEERLQNGLPADPPPLTPAQIQPQPPAVTPPPNKVTPLDL